MAEDAFDTATARGAGLRGEPHAISAAYAAADRMLTVLLSTGTELRCPVDEVQGLADATTADLAEIEISPTGRGLHFPRLDADVYVPALIAGRHGSVAWIERQGAVPFAPRKVTSA